MDREKSFIYETHGIHIGTLGDHVKHGVDEVDTIIEKAISMGHPSITFIIHTPRLTKFRYASERATDIKFIRGDSAYFDYPNTIKELKKKYSGRIKIKYGVELEWMGTGLGLQWNRSKVLQAQKADFVIGSVHFSPEGIPYDGSKEEAEQLVKLRGGIENYWLSYIEEMIEMVDQSHDMINVVGHIDLPKLNVPMPKELLELDTSSNILARRMRTLIEMISDYNLAMDLNLAGLKKGCGIYPELEILERAVKLNIPLALGTDTHSVAEYGKCYKEGIEFAQKAEYKHYVSFAKGIPEKRPFINVQKEVVKYNVLNLGIEAINRRFEKKNGKSIPKFSFGGDFRSFRGIYKDAQSLGDYEAIRVRKENKSLTITDRVPGDNKGRVKGLFSLHKDFPGVLSILFNTLASEGINVETAYLNSNEDGTATANLTLTGEEKMIKEAVEFIKGTAGDKFIDLEYSEKMHIPKYKQSKYYLMEVDGVDLPIPISKQMLISVHRNTTGILLILLSALAAKNINVNDLQLGKRGSKGYAVLGIDGDAQEVKDAISKLGPQFFEISHLRLQHIENI